MQLCSIQYKVFFLFILCCKNIIKQFDLDHGLLFFPDIEDAFSQSAPRHIPVRTHYSPTLQRYSVLTVAVLVLNQIGQIVQI